MNDGKLHLGVLVNLYSKVNTSLCKWQYEKWCGDNLKVEEPTLEEKVRRFITVTPQSSEDVFLFQSETKDGLLSDIKVWLDKMTTEFSGRDVVGYSLEINDYSYGGIELGVTSLDQPKEDEVIEYQEDMETYKEMVRIKPIILELYQQKLKQKAEEHNNQILAKIEELKKRLK